MPHRHAAGLDGFVWQISHSISQRVIDLTGDDVASGGCLFLCGDIRFYSIDVSQKLADGGVARQPA
jgi:hypothetical protein